MVVKFSLYFEELPSAPIMKRHSNLPVMQQARRPAARYRKSEQAGLCLNDISKAEEVKNFSVVPGIKPAANTHAKGYARKPIKINVQLT